MNTLFEVIDTTTGLPVKDWSEELRNARKANDQWGTDLMVDDIDQPLIGADGTLYLLDDCGNCNFLPEWYEVRWLKERV